MAKKDNTAEVVEEFDMYEGLTPEQVAELKAMSGMNNVNKGKSVPVLKINVQVDEDKQGKTAKHGDFVLNQIQKNDVLEEIGENFGSEVEIIIYSVPQQYSYYNNDKSKRCNSQLLFGYSDVPVGSNLKFNCRDKTCPRRQEGLEKGEKCSAQILLYATIEGKPCLFYAKGANFMPISDYLRSFGAEPPYAYTTVLKKTKKKQGSVIYYELQPEKGRRMSQLEFRDNTKKALEIASELREYESGRASKVQEQKALPNFGGDDFDDSKFGNAKVVNSDEIAFD